MSFSRQYYILVSIVTMNRENKYWNELVEFYNVFRS